MDDVDFQQDEGEDGDEAELMQGMDTDDDNQEPLTNIQSNSNVHSFTQLSSYIHMYMQPSS